MIIDAHCHLGRDVVYDFEVTESRLLGTMAENGIGGAIDKLKEFLGMDTKKNIEVTYHVNDDGTASGGWSGSGGNTDGRDIERGPVRRNALGTAFWRGGPTQVNERGGEIINLPSGSQVIPHDISQRMVGGPKITVNVTVQGNVIGNKQYADELCNVIGGKLLRALANT